MRRSIVAVTLAAGLTLSVQAAGSPQPAGAAEADPGSVTGPQAPDPHAPDPVARDTLATAQAAFHDVVPASDRRTTSTGRPDATLALRDLFLSRDRLSGDDRQQADGLLARPTDGLGDPLGNGYAVPAERECRNHFCVHWVTTTTDAPPSQDWVDGTLDYMNKVWRTEVQDMGYRPPISDGNRGGNSKFDIYLKELGSQGVYGYCAPENRTPQYKWLADGYCVLDNDFAQAQYGAPPKESLRVTAAHEFFHAIQFAYDYGEDGWLMESTATWMEERVADDVNDNRQYLPAGQVGDPGQPLDVFSQQGFNQYGNWPFFEYLGTRFGNGIVKAIWTRAGAFPGSGHQYSTTAVKGVLERHGGFVDVFGAYAAANTVPDRSYPEGAAWPTATPDATWQVSRSRSRASKTLEVNHMASRSAEIRPASSLSSKRWRLHVVVAGPTSKTDPTAYLVVERIHGVAIKPLPLDRRGRGHLDIPFSSAKVRSATVVLVNASTRFACWHRTSYSCQGRARDNHAPFTVRTTAHR